MNKSDQINELAAALAKAQGEIQAAAKDKKNPHYGSAYADLASVWDACRSQLSKNGLSVAQVVESDDGMVVTISTVLMHTSGQFVSGMFKMKPVKADPQGIGSATTYARRYALSAIVGVAPDDDDGNAATGKAPIPESPVPPQRTTPKPSDRSAKSEMQIKIEKWFGYPPEETKLIAAAWSDLKDAASVGLQTTKEEAGNKVRAFCDAAWAASLSFEEAMKGAKQ